MQNKQKEIELLKRGRLPAFSFYTGFNLYGRDPNELGRSFDYMSKNAYTVGVSASMYLFDGSRRSAQIEKAKLELQKIKLEKEKTLSELDLRFKKIEENQDFYKENIQMQNEILVNFEKKYTAAKRLRGIGIEDENGYLDKEIAFLEQQINLKQTCQAPLFWSKFRVKILALGAGGL